VIAAFCAFDSEPRWLPWREEERGSGSKRTKIPYCARTGKLGSSTDPQTWATRPDAERYCREHFNGEARSGIGIALGDIGDNTFLCGLDLDSSIGGTVNLAAPRLRNRAGVSSRVG